MKRYLYLILFALVLALPFGLRLVLVRGQSSGTIAGAEHLTVVTPHNQDIRREFARAFNQWHIATYGTPVQIDYLTPGGTEDIRRLLDSTYDGYRDRATGKLPADVRADIDVVFGGGDFFFYTQLQPRGILQSIHLSPQLIHKAFPEERLAGVRLLDLMRDAAGNPAPQWVGVCLSAFGIVYNPDMYKTLKKAGLKAPTSWASLADYRLKGLVALADPTHSGSAAVAYMMVLQRNMADAENRLFRQQPALGGLPLADLQKNADYRKAIAAGWKKGMNQLVLIAANARYFTDSASQVPTDVGNGQAAAGMAIDFYGRVTQEVVGRSRCRVILPRAATAITPDPVGILYGVKGRQLELATHFVEFLLSPEGQLLWIAKPGTANGPNERALRRPPIRRDLYADRNGWSDSIDPFKDAGGFNQRGDWMGLFSDTRTIWTAAWIDSRDNLKAAYERVLTVRTQKRRSALLAELANLPITLADVEQMRADRGKAEAAGRGAEWRAETQLAWANKFREHYRQIMGKVGRAPARSPQTARNKGKAG